MTSIHSIEKPDAEYATEVNTINRDTTLVTSNNDSDCYFEKPQDDWSDVDEKQVLKKIDWHLLPLVSVLYLLAYLDRGNIGNAKIEGLAEDLNIDGNQYNICLTVFFITYALFEVPSNMLLKKIGSQKIYIPSIMLAWGIVMVCMGVVQNYHGLLVTRLLLGVFGKLS